MTRGPIPRFDLYEELEVSRLASAEVIDAAYRTLVKRHHPDVAAGEGAADGDRIKRLNVAHGWLTDPARRRRYDDATADAAAAAAAAKKAPGATRRSSVTEAATGPAAPTQDSGPMGFGPNSAEVRQFLADLRPISVARAAQMLDARAAAPSTPYAEARGVALRASRAGRQDQWLLARDAATVIAQGKLADWPHAKEAATIVADVAGALVVRDLIPLADFQALLLPWTWRPEAVVEAAPGPGVRTAGLAGLGKIAGAMGAMGAVGAARSAVRAQRPQTIGIAASVLVALVALSAIVFGGPKLQEGVAALTDAPTGLTAAASPAGSIGVGQGESAGPATSFGPIATGPGSAPPTEPTVGPAPSTFPTPRVTPRPTALPTFLPTAVPTLVPTPVPTPSPIATASPSPTAAPPMCTVVNLVGVNTSNAQLTWSTAGFTGTVLFSPAIPPQYKIGWQSLGAGTDAPCTSDITVQPAAP